MTITKFFQQLAAPLKNYRWSWGAISQEEQCLFLRVWGHETMVLDGRLYVQVTNHAQFNNKHHPGYRERCDHIAQIKKGLASYCVMCTATDPGFHPKKLGGFDDQQVRRTGALIEYQGNEWLELLDYVPANDLMRKTSALS